ncbi:FAD-binding oxidoreductase [Aeromicrobium sp. CTD01-1L150]|uniref:FAD-binding oxidoreductase n=1 Tax=Aeromicrobium sp. CTD01-1L150 TaxID=3341830 RepID=UPI0035C09D64
MTDLLARAAPLTAPGPRWVDDVDAPLLCTEIIDVTHDVKSFTFTLTSGAWLRFLPGQYLTFRLDVDGVAVERCYTISSAATRADRLTITVKRVPGGPVSSWLHDRLRVGDMVSASGPLGRFTSAFHPADRYLFLTAGSGITPAMSMLRTARDDGPTSDIAFVHCARTPADIIFRDELDELAGRHGVNVPMVCESDSADETWHGPRGRLSLATLLTHVPDLLDREIFTCGPPAFMASVREMLGLLGVDPVRCHEESFDLGGSAQDSTAAPTGVAHRVELRRSGVVLDCDENTPVLTAASRAGVTLPSSCAEGLCGTCKSGLLSGSVDMQHAGGIRPREIDEGKILLCCSTPCEDLVIDA